MRHSSEEDAVKYIDGEYRKVTNCIDVAYLRKQIQKGNVYAEEQTNGMVFLVDRESHYLLFYFLLEPIALNIPIPHKPLVCEEFCRGDVTSAVMEASEFSIFSSYCRMGKRGSGGEKVAQEHATQDALSMVQEYFNSYSDSLPTKEEVGEFLEEHYEISCIKPSGILLYDIKKAVSTLKYITVRPQERGKGLAGTLMEQYFEKTAGEAKRYLLWVNEKNEAALKLYHRFGYQADGFRKVVWEKGLWKTK